MTDLAFGTDGIRGIYGDTLTEETAYRLGAALGKKGSVLIGRDNRPSSPVLARALACGVESAGGRYQAVGVLTTPALYYLLTKSDHNHAVMITASHNPPEHNGLKVFSPAGKPGEEERRAIEEGMRLVLPPKEDFQGYPFLEDSSAISLYEDFFRRSVGRLDGLTAVIDFAGGAGYVFKGLLGSLGVRVIPLNLCENGDRINLDSGALHPERCASETRRLGADIGFALDGDGDRIIASDGAGNILDGDRIAYLFACRMKKRGALLKNKLVMTVMTNSGVLKSLSKEGISVLSCRVGDTAVAEAMRSEGLNLGAEQSGHIILGDHLMTGDALLVGAMLLKSIREDGPLAETPPPLIYPQVLLNISVPDRNIAYRPDIQALAAKLKENLGEGRVLLRASGTEELVRIMVEHPDRERAQGAAERIAETILTLSR